MAAIDEVDELIERYQLALDEFMKGNPEPVKMLWSHCEEASLTNPQGSVARGWTEIAEAADRAASTRRDGRFLGFETVAKGVTGELAYVVEVEHLVRGPNTSVSKVPLLSVSAKTRMVALVKSTSVICNVPVAVLAPPSGAPGPIGVGPWASRVNFS